MKLGYVRLACLSSGLAVLLTMGPVWAQVRDLEQEKAQALQEQQQLKQRLEALQEQLSKTQRQRQRAADDLQASEAAISATMRRMSQLDAALVKAERELASLDKKMMALQKRITLQRAALAEQLRAQYSSGLNEWSTLLAGEDPQSISRDLGYLAFVSRSRAENIAALRQDQQELSQLTADQTQQKQSVVEMRQKLAQEQAELVKEKSERQKVLTRINQQLSAQRLESKQLDEDQQRLSGVIEGLSQQIERWRAQQQANESKAMREAALAALPQGSGIKRGMPRPVAGPVLARFGSKQPDGGAWRGVLMGANEGDPVKAVAAGMVVFSKWLSRFGNLIIVDHGDEFLTVYAYNQSLLKEVGDAVQTGEVLALAGNTGGQLDSALYFELRHQGIPLDPMLYFKNE